MDKNVEQSSNILGPQSVMAARDANIYNLPAPRVDAKQLNKLLEKYRHEKATNQQFRETIARLAYYKNYADNEVRRTLEEKLVAGKRASEVKHALRMKEFFARQLLEHELYESAQDADAYLLGEICTRFNNAVYPSITRSEPEALIAALIETQVIAPILQLLSDDDVLAHRREEVFGMIYFLTGNCHINWD